MISIRELSNHTGRVLQEVAERGRPAIITNNGQPVAAVISLDRHAIEALEDYVLMTSPQYVSEMEGATLNRTRDAETVRAEQAIRFRAAGNVAVRPFTPPRGLHLSRPALVAAAALASAVAFGVAVAMSDPGRERLGEAARLLRDAIAAQGEDADEFITTLEGVLAAAHAPAGT